MTKRDDIKKINKSEIHKSALGLFGEKGYFQTSIADISKRADFKGLILSLLHGQRGTV